jgi:hypothetical protein
MGTCALAGVPLRILWQSALMGVSFMTRVGYVGWSVFLDGPKLKSDSMIVDY